jgi:hypothetical protein
LVESACLLKSDTAAIDLNLNPTQREPMSECIESNQMPWCLTSGMDLTLKPTWKQSQNSEHIGLNCMPWSITYKAGTTGDIPPTEVLIKGRGISKHIRLKQEEDNGNMIG